MSGVVDRVLEAGECLVCRVWSETQGGTAVGTERRQTTRHDDRYHGDRDAERESRRTGYVVIVVVQWRG